VNYTMFLFRDLQAYVKSTVVFRAHKKITEVSELIVYSSYYSCSDVENELKIRF
jgi:hypothetical protein